MKTVLAPYFPVAQITVGGVAGKLIKPLMLFRLTPYYTQSTNITL